MNKRRLNLLVKKLEKLPRKQFDYGKWVNVDTWKGKKDLSCGTQACALGWATTIPSLQKAGLYLAKHTVFDNYYGDRTVGEVRCVGQRRVRYDDNGLVTSINAAKNVFGLTKEEAEYLFLPEYSDIGSDATPKRVARHIRKFVERGGMP